MTWSFTPTRSLAPGCHGIGNNTARDLPRSYAVKDSFARLDLAAEGLTLVFEAEWMAYSPPTRPGRATPACAGTRSPAPAN